MPANGALHGLALDRQMKINLIAISALFLLAHLLLGISFLKRRRSKLPRLLFVEVSPLIALCGLYIWMAITAQQLWAANRFEGPSPTAMQVEVVGVQFQWYFRYPGEDATFGATSPKLVNAGAGNPLGLDPKTRKATTTSSLANSSCPPAAKSIFACAPGTSSTDSSSPA